jgi:prefoldin alpha subunit
MANLSQKVLLYEEFLNERLRSDLHKVLAQRDKVCSDVGEYNQLKTTINLLHSQATSSKPKTLKTMVDLGCNFYTHAKVDDCSKIVVSVGLGFYLEMTLKEALAFVEKKVSNLTDEMDRLSEQAAQINGRIKVVMETLRELQFSSQF